MFRTVHRSGGFWPDLQFMMLRKSDAQWWECMKQVFLQPPCKSKRLLEDLLDKVKLDERLADLTSQPVHQKTSGCIGELVWPQMFANRTTKSK